MRTSTRLRMTGRGLLAAAAVTGLAGLPVLAAPAALAAAASSVTAPGIHSFSPARGAAGTEVTITGSGFAKVTAVRIRGAVPAGAVRAAGPWGRAVAVPGLRALNRGRDANVSSVSCASPGNCAAGGDYRIYSLVAGPAQRGFVVDERHGRWGRAIRVPGLRTLSAGKQSSVDSVSCGSAGNCAAGGDYWHGHGGFVAVEKNGRWVRAIKVVGPVSSVSCGSAGNCAAGGTYWSGGRQRGFVAVEKNGVWGRGIEVPGLGALNAGGNAGVDSMSCASAGNCAAGGRYRNQGRQGFMAVEKNGRWGQAIEVPGLGGLNTGGNAEVYSVSCPSAGDCAAGGGYTDSNGGYHGFVVSERNGVWGQAIEVPGLGTLNAGNGIPDAYVGSVSCASAGNCAAGGSAGRPLPLGFVASEKDGVWGQAIVMPGPGSGVLATAQEAGVSSVSCAPAGNCAAGGWYLDLNNHYHGLVAVERNDRWGQATQVPGITALTKGGARRRRLGVVLLGRQLHGQRVLRPPRCGGVRNLGRHAHPPLPAPPVHPQASRARGPGRPSLLTAARPGPLTRWYGRAGGHVSGR